MYEPYDQAYLSVVYAHIYRAWHSRPWGSCGRIVYACRSVCVWLRYETAERLISSASSQGTWVLLRNIHLCPSWLEVRPPTLMGDCLVQSSLMDDDRITLSSHHWWLGCPTLLALRGL